MSTEQVLIGFTALCIISTIMFIVLMVAVLQLKTKIYKTIENIYLTLKKIK